MSKKEPKQNLLEFALIREQKAHQFYQDLAQQTNHPIKRMLFERFAREELSHMDKLKTHISPSGELADLDIVAPLLAEDSDEQMTPQIKEQLCRIIANAIQKEKNSFRLYMDLAMKVHDESAREILMELAKDEANHQALLELEFDRVSNQR